MTIAAVIYEKGSADAVDAILSSIAERLRAEGHALAGAVQVNGDGATSACSDMMIVDLATGRTMDVANPLRARQGGCRLDQTALEDVAGVIAAGLDSAAALVIVNRFGKQEMMGNGLRAVIENAVAQEIPLLTAVNEGNKAAWDEFAGGLSQTLPPDRVTIEMWCREVLAARIPAST